MISTSFNCGATPKVGGYTYLPAQRELLLPDETLPTVFGIHLHLIRCQICRRKATQFKVKGTEVLKETILEGKEPEIMGVLLGFYCDIHANTTPDYSPPDSIDELVD